MKYIKKSVCLILALIIICGLSVSSLAVFTDNSVIHNTGAAEVLTSLQIIQGFPDGSFRPRNDVTRGQLAKMMYYILNGIEDIEDDGAYNYVGRTSLKDISGHWAEGYVYYCYSNKIIAGYTDGTFKADKNVTGYETLKMLLVALGYDPSLYVGENWSQNVTRNALEAGLLEDFTGSLSSTLDRDDAALFIYNALYAEEIAYDNGVYTGKGTTLLTSNYSVTKATITVISNEEGSLEGEPRPNGYTTALINPDTSPKYLSFAYSSGIGDLGKSYTAYIRRIKSDTYQIIGTLIESPELMYIDDTSGEPISSYIGADKRLTGFADDAKYYINCEENTAVSFRAFANSPHLGSSIIYISNDGDKLVDYALAYKPYFAQIEYYVPGNEGYLSFYNSDLEIPLSSVVTEDTLSSGSYCTVLNIGSRYFLSAPKTETGTVESYKAGSYIRVGGVNYPIAYIDSSTYVSGGTGGFIPASLLANSDYLINHTFDFCFDKNDVLLGAVLHTGDALGYALLVSSSGTAAANGSSATLKAELLLSGEKNTSIYSVALTSSELNSALSGDIKPHGLYSYSAISDGTVYGLKDDSSSVSPGTKVAVTTGSSLVSGIPGLRADSGTVFFFWDPYSDNPAVYTGIDRVPSCTHTVTSRAGVYYTVRSDDSGKLGAVFIGRSDPGVVNASTLVYIPDTTPEVSLLNGDTMCNNYYGFDENGAYVTLHTSDEFLLSEVSAKNNVYCYTTSNSVSTITAPSGYSSSLGLVTRVESGYIKVEEDSETTMTFYLDSAKLEIYYINSESGTIAPYTIRSSDEDRVQAVVFYETALRDKYSAEPYRIYIFI